MAQIEIRLPKMGESVTEATITNWLKNVGDTIEMDEPLVEVATDKVDNELPSEAEGVLVKQSSKTCLSNYYYYVYDIKYNKLNRWQRITFILIPSWLRSDMLDSTIPLH